MKIKNASLETILTLEVERGITMLPVSYSVLSARARAKTSLFSNGIYVTEQLIMLRSSYLLRNRPGAVWLIF